MRRQAGPEKETSSLVSHVSNMPQGVDTTLSGSVLKNKRWDAEAKVTRG